jgi:hypothetical protein
MLELADSSVADGLGTCLAIVVLAAMVTVVIIFVRKAVLASQERWAAFLVSLSGRVNGEYFPAGFRRLPQIAFLAAGRWRAAIEFQQGDGDNTPFTRVRVHLEGRAPGIFHLIPDGIGQSFLKMFGAQDILIGNAAFDRDYVIKATPESLAARIFSPNRRNRVIASMRRLEGMSEPTLSVIRDELVVKVSQFIENEGAAMRLVQTAEDFLEYLFQVSTPGIELGELHTAPSGTCPVCGTAMDSKSVRCESCRTPHHVECWTYMGRCSTYACQGRRPTTN